MKEITMNNKLKIIKLFLSGLSYDDIAMQVGVAKGSVVNIIDQFREGELPIPPGVTEYIDELRKVAIDMKKHSTTVSQLKGYIKLHAKIKEMGVDTDHIEQWLDICQGIATATVSNSQFVSAALELAQLTADTGQDYESAITDYKAKIEASKVLEAEIEQKKAHLTDIKEKTTKEKEQATKELDAITKAIATAQEIFSKQKKELRAQLDEYMVQNKISWETVKIVVAILESELSGAGLDQEQRATISKQIAKAGSLTIYTKELEDNREILEAEVGELGQQKKFLTGTVNQGKVIYQQLANQLLEKTNHRSELDAEIKAKRAALAQLEEIISGYGRDIYAAWLVLAFLSSRDLTSDYDFDQIVKLMLGIRQFRLGIGPKRVTDAKGKVVCECQVPAFSIPTSKYGASTEEAEQRLALCLIPLVKDKFVPKFEYDLAQIDKAMVELHKHLLDLKL